MFCPRRMSFVEPSSSVGRPMLVSLQRRSWRPSLARAVPPADECRADAREVDPAPVDGDAADGDPARRAEAEIVDGVDGGAVDDAERGRGRDGESGCCGKGRLDGL